MTDLKHLWFQIFIYFLWGFMNINEKSLDERMDYVTKQLEVLLQKEIVRHQELEAERAEREKERAERKAKDEAERAEREKERAERKAKDEAERVEREKERAEREKERAEREKER